jgi:glyceraldehyde 3-phosphate dehydrogenase
MAKLKIGINGFGRIGRLFARVALQHPDLEIVGINDLVPPDNLAYLLKYDSTHGIYPGKIAATADGITIDDRFIPCTAIRNPAELPWGKLGVDYAIESTGLFTDFAGAQSHIQAGAKRVIISAPTKEPDKIDTFVVGVNHQSFDPDKHYIVSNASCTTNCLAPVARIIDEQFGLSEGLMTTVHAVTATQPTVDGPSKKDWRGGRGSSQNIIPASTGAAKAVGLVLPQLQGKLTGMALRVPTPDVSVVDLTFKTSSATTYRDICTAMATAAEGQLNGILAYTEDEIVSTDFRGDAHSSIFDAGAGMELNSNFFKIVAWYDNEWGYSNRIADLAVSMARREGVLN